MPANSLVVRPYTLVVDTREQSAYDFRTLKADKKEGGGPLVIRTVRKTLQTGDYSIEGIEDQCVIERKELSDFLNCVGNDRERFENQLSRLNSLTHGVVVVEADLGRALIGTQFSKILPKTVIRSLIAWQMDYFPSVHWWFAPTRRHAEGITFRILDRFYSNHQPRDGAKNEKNG